MRKTLLAAVIGAGVFAVLPALAQVSLGGAGRVGAGLTGGASGALGATPGQLAVRPGQTLQRADRHVRHTTRHATAQTHRTLDRHGQADVDTAARGSAGIRAGDHRADADAGVRTGASVDAGAAADRTAATARGVGDQVSDRVHTAAGSAERTAGSVGDAARRTATGNSVGADARVRAQADEHGH
ncbi:MAG TPA: hypothetical protein VFH59_10975 [Frateuria sp.]|uniref:hypothetical protein n=1 Tax=Frateuria sp. TaxID=2211372 RepID=UPI002D7E2CE1|nr:hypothetical protein [Frateuria sp.]HET6805950.1 hypothetical protein [Frateuria sp.]